MIVNVDQNWGIGLKNQLLVRIPADLKFFREHTENHVVVCGRHTLESFPGQVPLPNRTTIVLSRNPKYNVRHAIMARSVEDLIGILKEEGYDLDDVYIIGGQKVYQDLHTFRIWIMMRIGSAQRSLRNRLTTILSITLRPTLVRTL